ncbi:MAG: sugar phosphate isomerase/epimerase [Nitrospirae bacterium]|nr:sugar phosphate isomerase/epimerase [Nitrospirota bacterium]
MNDPTRPRIGNQTAFSASSIMRPFEYAIANGFDAFEWFPDKKESGAGWDENDLSKETRAWIRDTSVAHDVKLTVHAPWQFNPLKVDAREHLAGTTAFAMDIGALLVNIHYYPDEGAVSFMNAVAPLVRLLSRAGIKLSIENTPHTRPDDFNELFGIMKRMQHSEHIGMCLDIGHANLCSATRNDYLKFVDMLDAGLPIIHVHMHENFGDQDSHLPLFTGPAGRDGAGINGIMRRLRKRGFSGCIILEQWPQPPGPLIDARNRLLSIIG